ncbi:TPA: hypothetical protein EYP44_03175 [Candidatus Bathyarchaeota archaeon]|nr:hypothetical protein [Candidatus Bathyarchaeota archaeon]
MQVAVRAGETVIVRGPARVEAQGGRVEVFGKPLEEGHVVIVRQGDSLPIEGKTESSLAVTAEEDHVSKIDGSTIPPSWNELSDEIARLDKPATIMVLGDVNTGKTALITYLGNVALTRGFRVAVIDLDVGQQNLGPPTTLGMGFLREPVIALAEVPVDVLSFVGNTSPHGRLLQIITGARRLLERARSSGADVILIDTTGWIYGRGAWEFKTAKINMIRPTMVVAIQRKGELEPILSPLRHTRLLIRRLNVPPNVDVRTQSVRRFRRESSFKRYLSGSRSLVLNFADVGFVSTTLGNGTYMSRDVLATIEKVFQTRVVYCERTPSNCLIVTSTPKSLNPEIVQAVNSLVGVEEVTITSKGEERGLLVGLLDEDGDTLGLGVVQQILYERRKIRILTSVRGKISQICFGSIRLSETGAELEHVSVRL